MLRLKAPSEDKVVKSTLIKNDEGEVVGMQEEYSSGFIDILDTITACEDLRSLAMLTQKLSRDVDLADRLAKQLASRKARLAA